MDFVKGCLLIALWDAGLITFDTARKSLSLTHIMSVYWLTCRWAYFLNGYKQEWPCHNYGKVESRR